VQLYFELNQDTKWLEIITLFVQELEKLASRKLRISAKETMKIAEKLYTSGFISYPRTETNMFAKEIDLASMVENQTRDPNWGGNGFILLYILVEY
jgi:DNA topoisomerase-3